jgi:signal transduction histidine kinase/CheY-like chemotaxis protein/HPt (histidine-containing phosphotransfer) domain-containing protein
MTVSSNNEKRHIGDDWQKNWGSSIAVKVTAPVLWTLIFFGLLVAVIVQHNQTSELEAQFSREADQLAYIATRYLIDLEGGQPLDLPQVLEKAMHDMQLTHGEIQVNSRRMAFGKSSDRYTPVKITRQVLYTDSPDNPQGMTANMTLFHPPLDFVIKQQRKTFLITIGIPFFVFGLLLAWLIHVIVTRPIFELVNATRAVTEGDMSLRMETHRKDEFGHLSAFFNQMLDKLQAKQEQLSTAVIEAESANKMKSSFLANMSHEIRTPLTAIIGYSDLLKHETQTEEEREEQIDSIMRAGHHLQEIINDILDLSKIEAGELVIETLWVSPVEIMKEVEGLVALRAESKGLTFNVKYDYPLPEVIHTDPTRLRQILLNLCSNAVKFTHHGSVNVRVSYQPDQQQIQFDVTDSGIGVSDSEQQRLFKPFSQADTSTTRQFGGTGLGLAISKQLAERLGGDITCISRKEVGSKFTLTVATGEIVKEALVYQSPQASTKPVRSPGLPLKNGVQGKVLLAEDTPDNQMLISMYVRRTGAEVTVVENGKLACDKAMSEHFDLILMDMQMPVMDGIQATQRLRDAGYDKPIVALTANALQQDKERCVQAGADDYLTKPLDLTRFHAVMKRYLQPGNSDAQPSEHIAQRQGEEKEYQKLVNRFVARLPELAAKIKQSLAEENWAELRSTVHQLKGMGASFGFDEISQAAEQLQMDLDNDIFDQVLQQTSHLIEVCEISRKKNKLSGLG